MALGVVLGAGLWPHAAANAVEPGDVRSFLDAHCARCHGGAEPAAEFTLPTPSATPLGRPDLDSWKRIHEQLAALQMPPADAPPTLRNRPTPSVGRCSRGCRRC